MNAASTPYDPVLARCWRGAGAGLARGWRGAGAGLARGWRGGWGGCPFPLRVAADGETRTGRDQLRLSGTAPGLHERGTAAPGSGRPASTGLASAGEISGG
jgi:hypothetical protein